MIVREYRPDDAGDCLAVFDSNVPAWFRPHEREDYQRFLADPPGTYLVIESVTGVVVACGGYARDSAASAVLTYGIVHAEYHGQLLGTRLLQERLHRIRSELDVQSVVVNTTQLTEGFFARSGFQTVEVTPDHYAPGLHAVRMLRSLRAPELPD